MAMKFVRTAEDVYRVKIDGGTVIGTAKKRATGWHFYRVGSRKAEAGAPFKTRVKAVDAYLGAAA